MVDIGGIQTGKGLLSWLRRISMKLRAVRLGPRLRKAVPCEVVFSVVLVIDLHGAVMSRSRLGGNSGASRTRPASLSVAPKTRRRYIFQSKGEGPK